MIGEPSCIVTNGKILRICFPTELDYVSDTINIMNDEKNMMRDPAILATFPLLKKAVMKTE